MQTTLDEDEEIAGAELSDLGNGVFSAQIGEPIPLSAPEGLYVVGNFDPARPSIVYVHGWVPDGNAPRAFNLEGWQSAGFNTLLVRWHVAATDSAAGCPGGGGFLGIPNTPCNAEARIFGQRGSNPAANYAGERMVQAYRSFFGAYSSPGRVRMVAHSLGAQMATYITYRLVREGWAGRAPDRIDLLDPFAGTGDPGTPHPSYVVPSDESVGGGSCGDGNRGTGYCRLENSLQFLRNRGVAVLTLRASASSRFTNDLHYVTPVVELGSDWLGSDSQRHAGVLPWYMCGIGPVASATADCAANPGFARPYIARGAASPLGTSDALAHGSVFNWRYYAEMNPDLAGAGITSPSSLLSHWRNYGANECRVAHPYFAASQYRARYADLASMSCRDAARHYVNYGLAEGRIGTSTGEAYQPVLGPLTPTDVLSRLGGTSSGGIPLILKMTSGTDYSTASAHDDRFKY